MPTFRGRPVTKKLSAVEARRVRVATARRIAANNRGLKKISAQKRRTKSLFTSFSLGVQRGKRLSKARCLQARLSAAKRRKNVPCR